MMGTELKMDESHVSIRLPSNPFVCLASRVADGLAYSALLKNELLGAGIDKVQDPQSEDRRLQPSTPVKRSLFSVCQFV